MLHTCLISQFSATCKKRNHILKQKQKKNYWNHLRNEDGIIPNGYNTCDANLALKKQRTRGIPLMLSVKIFLNSCYPCDCYFNSIIKVFPMCSVKAFVFYQLLSFLQNIICVRFYWRKMVEYLLRYELDRKEINQLLWGCLLFVPGNQWVQVQNGVALTPWVPDM